MYKIKFVASFYKFHTLPLSQITNVPLHFDYEEKQKKWIYQRCFCVVKKEKKKQPTKQIKKKRNRESDEVLIR